MRLSLIISFLFLTCAIFAQDKLLYDSTTVETRSFKEAPFDEYKNDTDFQYESEVLQTPSIWDRFWAWVWRKYADIMSTDAGRYTMNTLFWVIGIGGLAFFIYKVARMNRLSLFAADQRAATAYKVEAEDIHAIEFDTAINEALQQGNYRLAVRLAYLQNLKMLADKELIDWRPNKTNTDYWRELATAPQQKLFKDITNVFEYAWYGSHTVTREDFETMKQELIQFKNQL